MFQPFGFSFQYYVKNVSHIVKNYQKCFQVFPGNEVLDMKERKWEVVKHNSNWDLSPVSRSLQVYNLRFRFRFNRHLKKTFQMKFGSPKLSYTFIASKKFVKKMDQSSLSHGVN